MAAVERYAPAARWLHAIVAALVVVLVLLGLTMTRSTVSFERLFAAYQWHKTLGVSLWGLMLVRVAVRWHLPPPPLSDAIASSRATIARVVHVLLYAVLLIMPLTGWLMVSASPLSFPVFLFGLIEIPSLAWLADQPDAERQIWFHLLKTAHTALAGLLLGLVAVHFAGALSHGRLFLSRMSLKRGSTDA